MKNLMKSAAFALALFFLLLSLVCAISLPFLHGVAMAGGLAGWWQSKRLAFEFLDLAFKI